MARKERVNKAAVDLMSVEAVSRKVPSSTVDLTPEERRKLKRPGMDRPGPGGTHHDRASRPGTGQRIGDPSA